MAMRSRPLAASRAGTVTGENSEREVMSPSFLSVDVRKIRITADQGVWLLYRFGTASRSLGVGRGDVVLNALLRLLLLRDEGVEIGGPVDEVDLVGVHDEEGRLFVMVEVIVVGLDQLRDVFGRDSLLDRPRGFLDPLHAGLERPLEVDHEVRPGNGLREERVEAVVDHELGVVQVQARENLVLGEVVVGHDERREEIDLGEIALLLVPRQEKEELRLERGALLPLVEIGEKRVVHVLQDLRAVEPPRYELDERRLADADRAVDCDMAQGNIAFRRDRHRAGLYRRSAIARGSAPFGAPASGSAGCGLRPLA